MDEKLTPNAHWQLSVIEFMLEQSPRPCRREQHQPVELVIVVNAADEGKLALLEEQVASLQRKLAESEAAVEVQRSRALASEEQVASNTAVRARRLVISLKHSLRNLGANEIATLAPRERLSLKTLSDSVSHFRLAALASQNPRPSAL